MSQHTSRPATRALDDEPPVDPRNWLHHVLVDLHALSRIPRPAWAAGVITSGLLTGGVWYAVTGVLGIAAIAASVTIAFACADWAWLAVLPRRGISFGPVEPPLAGLIGVRLILGLSSLLGYVVGLSLWSAVTLSIGVQIAVWGLVFYATVVEPFRLGVTHLELGTAKLRAGRRMRLVQLSDLHVERITRRERELVERVNALDPDLILLTGDYLSFSYVGEPKAIDAARSVLGKLRAKAAVLAVRGTHQVDPNTLLPLLFEGLPVRWLRNEHVSIAQDGFTVSVAGASCTRDAEIDIPAVGQALAKVPGDTFTVMLFHTPERVSEASAAGVDLYLAGHTHGGQLRIPLYGALLTATDVGKRYEMGRYDIGSMVLYVSRGIGMEGMAAPRARFLCPPEIVCIDVLGQG